MDEPHAAGALSTSVGDPLDELLEEISEPLASPEQVGAALGDGAQLAPEDEEPFTITRLLRNGFPLRLYEASQEDGEETLWLWERAGESASSLADEGKILQDVRCPMFPRVQAIFRHDDRCYLATESCPGESLAKQFHGGRVDALRAVSILSQVTFALTKLHAAGFVHLGLRPDVIVPGRPVKITDFSDVTRVGEVPARRFYYAGYSPPELLQGDPADVRSDIYSVGALLFHAVGGEPIAESGPELLSWEPKAPVAGVPQVLTRCLGDKDSRYSSAAELHRDLVRLARRLIPPVRYAIGACTSIGLEPSRTTNQDAYTYSLGSLECEEEAQSWLMACVADGMGGMQGGEVASGEAVRSVRGQALSAASGEVLLQAEAHVSEVKKWAREANDRVTGALEKRQAKGGSTLLCVCLVGYRLAASHVGDCRLYLIRGEETRVLTRDHSLAMALAMQGEISPDDVRTHPERSRVTRSLGERRALPDYLVDTVEQVTGSPTMELEPGDTLLLCTDGVWELLLDDELASYVRANGSDLNDSAEAIVKAALARGGGDNATAVLVRLQAEL